MHRAVTLALQNAGIEQERLLRPDEDIAERAFLHLCKVYNLPLPKEATGYRQPSTASSDFVLPQRLAFYAAIQAYMMDSGYSNFSMDDLFMPRGNRLSDQLEALARFGEFRESALNNLGPRFANARRLETELAQLEELVDSEKDRTFSTKRALAQLLPEHQVQMAAYSLDEKEVKKLQERVNALENEVNGSKASLTARERAVDGDEQVARSEYDMYSQIVYLLKENSCPEDQLSTIRRALDSVRSEKQAAKHQLESCRTTSQLFMDLEKHLPQLTEGARQASEALSAHATAQEDYNKQSVKLEEVLAEITKCQTEKVDLSQRLETAKTEASRLAEESIRLQELRKAKEQEFDQQEQETNTKVAEIDAVLAEHNNEIERLDQEIALVETQLSSLEPKLLAQEVRLHQAAHKMLSLLVELSEAYPPSSQGSAVLN